MLRQPPQRNTQRCFSCRAGTLHAAAKAQIIADVCKPNAQFCSRGSKMKDITLSAEVSPIENLIIPCDACSRDLGNCIGGDRRCEAGRQHIQWAHGALVALLVMIAVATLVTRCMKSFVMCTNTSLLVVL